MFKKSDHKRRLSGVYLLFRMGLSLVIFALLLGGLYGAYKSFSGFDPLKLDSKSVISNLLSQDTLQKVSNGLIPAFGGKASTEPNKGTFSTNKGTFSTNKNVKFSFLLVADSHSENNYLNKAIIQAKKKSDLKFIIGLGDYTEVGTMEELAGAKKEFDVAGIRYFLVPGDHDFWDSRDKQKPVRDNFIQTFGPTYQAFTYQNIRFILLDNADNYRGLGETQIKWLGLEFERTGQDSEVKAVLAFMHKPLYHPSSTHIMGSVDPNLKEEAKNLARWFKENNTKGIFYGDIHYFTQYQDPDGLTMVTVGAVASQRNPQNPRFAIVRVYEDLSFDVEDSEIK